MDERRIAAVTFDYYPFDVRVRRLAEAAADGGFRTDVICLRQPGEAAREVYNGVEIFRVPQARGFGNALPLTVLAWCWFIVLAGAVLTWLHVRRRYAVIHVHNMPDFLVFCALIPKLLGARVILDVQDVSPELMSAKARGRSRALLFRLAALQEGLSARFADHVVTVGWPFERALLARGIPERKLSIILNSADPKLFPPERRRPQTAALEQGGEAEQPLTLAYWGTVAERNGLDIAVRALALAREQVSGLRLAIMGRGEQVPELKRLVAELGLGEVVSFSDPVAAEHIVDFVERADIGIIPYRVDGFAELVLPTKAYELAWMRIPIIAAETAGIRSMFRPASITLCAPGDPESFAAAIVALASDPPRRAAQVASAAEDYVPYEWEGMSARYCALLGALSHGPLPPEPTLPPGPRFPGEEAAAQADIPSPVAACVADGPLASAPVRARHASSALLLAVLVCLLTASGLGLTPLGIASGLPRMANGLSPTPPVALPGQQMWNQGASSLLFGTNDTYEWSPQNIQTSPAIQKAIRTAGLTLMRSFFPDNATDAQIEQRIRTIENSGTRCLGVITNPANVAFNRHLVAYLGARCQLYEIGNEPDYTGVSLATYLAQWNTLVPQLRRINPNAKFIGPATYNDAGKGNFMLGFLEGVKTSGVLPDAVSFHWYPCHNKTRAQCLALADSYTEAGLGVRKLVRAVLGRDLPVGISEWNFSPGDPFPVYGDDADFITQFTQRAIQAMARAGLAFACQFDAASYSGYGHLDMFDAATGQPKPQFTALSALIRAYRPATPATSAASRPTASASASGPQAGALLSRGKPVYCSTNNIGSGGSGALVNGHYGAWSFWRADLSVLPAWCAIHLGAGPARLLLTWESDYSFDYLGDTSMAPQDYTLAVSADSTNGADGTWRTVATVTGNHARAREHLLPFAGEAWVKMLVTRGQPHASQPYITIDQMDLYDAAKGAQDTYIFYGDSITAMAYNRFDENGPAFADLVHAADPARYPATVDAGFGGWTSRGAVEQVGQLLALNPDIRYWLLGWGTNDALGQVAPEAFRANLQQLVGQIRQAGHIPVLAHIPYAHRPGADGTRLDQEIRTLNGVIDTVTAANQLPAGPDLYAIFQAHQATYLLDDGIHPSPAGARAMNAAWFAVWREQRW